MIDCILLISVIPYNTMGMSHGSAHHFVHDVLQFYKVSARWVPRPLTAELKERRVDACQELLKQYEAGGNGFLGRTVTGDETWVHNHQPGTKKASKEWRHTSSPKQKKFRTRPSAGKVMLTLFWDKPAALSTKWIFSRSMHALSKRCNTCMECSGD